MLTVTNQSAQNNVQTTNGTQTTCVALTCPEDSTTAFEGRIVGRSSSAQAGWRFEGVVKRVGSANAVLVGLTIPEAKKEAGALFWSATVDVSGSDLRIRVTGVAGTTIDWGGLVDAFLLLPNGGGS